jgi:large subunit ribosomal protein L21
MSATPTSASAPAAAAASAPAAAAASATAGEATDVYAIVEASGQQFWLQPNRYLDIDRLAAEVDSTVTLETVLLVKGATVELKVLAHRRGPKLLIYKMRPKKKTRRKNGHRQELTRVLVQSITVSGSKVA